MQTYNNTFYSPQQPAQTLTGTVFHANGVYLPLTLSGIDCTSCYAIELAAVCAMHHPEGTLVDVLKNHDNTICGFHLRVPDLSSRHGNERAALVFGKDAACRGPVFLVQFDKITGRYTSVTDAVFTEFWQASLPPPPQEEEPEVASSMISELDPSSAAPAPAPAFAPAAATAEQEQKAADTCDAMLPEVLRGLPLPQPAPLPFPLQPEASIQNMDNKDSNDDNPRPSKRKAGTCKKDKLDSSTLRPTRVRKQPARFTY